MKDEHRYSLTFQSPFVNSFPNFTEKISIFPMFFRDMNVTLFSVLLTI